MKAKYFLPTAWSLAAALAAHAALSPADADRLGRDLTPLGGEKSANADGSIPAWNGGITQAPAGFNAGDHHADPFGSDAIKFTITASNADQYADKLSAGHL